MRRGAKGGNRCSNLEPGERRGLHFPLQCCVVEGSRIYDSAKETAPCGNSFAVQVGDCVCCRTAVLQPCATFEAVYPLSAHGTLCLNLPLGLSLLTSTVLRSAWQQSFIALCYSGCWVDLALEEDEGSEQLRGAMGARQLAGTYLSNWVPLWYAPPCKLLHRCCALCSCNCCDERSTDDSQP